MAEVEFRYNHLSVEFGGPYKAGQRVELDDTLAARLVEAGEAVPATKRDATDLGADPDSAATQRK